MFFDLTENRSGLHADHPIERKLNIFDLAENAGASVDQNPPPSKEMARNIAPTGFSQ
jgi:hypothetical protein